VIFISLSDWSSSRKWVRETDRQTDRERQTAVWMLTFLEMVLCGMSSGWRETDSLCVSVSVCVCVCSVTQSSCDAGKGNAWESHFSSAGSHHRNTLNAPITHIHTHPHTLHRERRHGVAQNVYHVQWYLCPFECVLKKCIYVCEYNIYNTNCFKAASQ